MFDMAGPTSPYVPPTRHFQPQQFGAFMGHAHKVAQANPLSGPSMPIPSRTSLPKPISGPSAQGPHPSMGSFGFPAQSKVSSPKGPQKVPQKEKKSGSWGDLVKWTQAKPVRIGKVSHHAGKNAAVLKAATGAK